ncbi:hypothetical protein UFOVP1236_25 [uncultured Caudovirales phage]|uniref:Uncharacterized protein n=1 Tax=uncultured Caudovirales phage TaxID=2100421 RepID=A0A6J5R648_9CAUD|nr:hypothetical protein UFOVP1236_25 [uncultured Caudovirales phage]
MTSPEPLPAPVSPVAPEPPTESARVNPVPFVDTPVKQAKRRALHDPTVANLDALVDAALAAGRKPLRDALDRIRATVQGVSPADAINAAAEVWSISRDALSMHPSSHPGTERTMTADVIVSTENRPRITPRRSIDD